jgi:hypothetical protein
MSNSLFPFISQKWDFRTNNFEKLYQELNEDDKKKFNFDVKSVSVNSN